MLLVFGSSVRVLWICMMFLWFYRFVLLVFGPSVRVLWFCMMCLWFYRFVFIALVIVVYFRRYSLSLVVVL